jgi:hypothetical protein
MAKTFASLLALGLIVLFIAGCQPRPRHDGAVAVVLPAPNFDGKPVTQATPQPLPQPTRTAPTPLPQPPLAGANPRDWIPTAPARQWRWIVIHHSATPAGNAAVFTKMHLNNGWDELGYHFVIGNGTDSGNGQVEVGSRWPKQKWGAHAKTPDNRYNDYGIGICLVGNFENERPTPQQMQALARLTAHLMRTYRIPPERVIGHSDTRPTDCPGRYMQMTEVRRMAGQMVDSGYSAEEARPARAELELLIDERLP